MSAELGLKERKEGKKEGQMREIQRRGGRLSPRLLMLVMKGMRICHPKIYHFGIRIILS